MTAPIPDCSTNNLLDDEEVKMCSYGMSKIGFEISSEIDVEFRRAGYL
jgi:hypothetical protein